MKFDIEQIKNKYIEEQSSSREIMKYVFSILTLGIGALWLKATTKVIKEGQIGLREDSRGNMILLPSGRHSNFPWESYATSAKDLSKNHISMGPYSIITVESGYVAKTLNNGKLEILAEGQHLLQSASHVFCEFISVKQETKRLEEVQAYTNDNVGITMHADVRYQISNPHEAITKIDDIEESIKQISEMQLSSVIGHHNLQELIPAAKGLSSERSDKRDMQNQNEHGLSEVVTELMKTIGKHLNTLGIDLINIGIKSWEINDKALSHELGQGAVIQSQTASKMLTAKSDAEIMNIDADARAKAKITEAKSILKSGELLENSPVAINLAELDAQRKIVQSAAPGTSLIYGSTGNQGFFQMPLSQSSGQEPVHQPKSASMT